MTLVSIHCPVCHQSRDVEYPYECAWVKVAVCNACADRNQPVAVTIKPDPWSQHWIETCPREFRTKEEGGITDLERLRREQPAADKYLGWGGEYSLMFVGHTGGCKTRLAWRLVRGYHDLGKSHACFTSFSFQAAAQAAGGEYRLDHWSRDLVKLPLVFLDDLGKSPWTENTWGAFFYVVDQRLAHGNPTLITSNFTPQDLQASLTARAVPTLTQMVAPLLRRIREKFNVVNLIVGNE